ncbi:RNA-directed DNA polymerase, eukaryota, reverse transcriptase zinc-binding domain protein [Tanacetum coccineum]
MGAIPIHDERGTRFEGNKVVEQFVKYFKQFLGESVHVNKLQGCNDLFKKKLSSEEVMFMVREIQDNILISQELLKGYDRKNGPKRVALKIDLQKAYDTVNWNFLEDILNGFGFHGKMVNWTMKCVTSTSFSIVVNGESCGFFKGRRGIRQGDPISPYLFTLVMEILNLLMVSRVDNNGLFQYHFGCKQLKITHVCFADDLLMFYHGDPDSVKVIKEKILDVVPFRVEKLPVRYLGVPLITKRIGDQSDHVNGKVKVAWKILSMPKAKGGIGLRNLSIWNKAIITKHLWYVVVDKDAL